MSGKSVDEIILQYSTRGMDVIQKKHPVEHCKKAVNEFLKIEKGTVFLYTGFYVGGYAETDGPIGTYFLARALKRLGYIPIIVTDPLCDSYFKEIETIGIPFSGYSEGQYLDILSSKLPICHISIERCGKNAYGKYANMRGVNIGEFTAPVDDLFVLGNKSAPSFSIGDGGNEIGMGNFKSTIENDLSLVPCIVESDYPIIASVSNWGGYGFIAYLEEFYNQSVLPEFSEVDDYLDYILSLGAVDGVKSENVKSVDGKEWAIEKEILGDLRLAIVRHQNAFTMSDAYDENSKSQVSIGTKLIDCFDLIVEKGSSLLDIGCGSGVLTNKIHEKFVLKKVNVSGMDVDGAVIKKACSTYPYIKFFVGSFFQDGLNNQYDYIFSNEAMHWTPSIPDEFYSQDSIIYYFFDDATRSNYRDWGLSNFSKIIQFVESALQKKAIVQFGLDSQLYNVYEVINDVFLEFFPESIKSIKFPLFYPTLDEVKEIIENQTSLNIEMCKSETIELAEVTREEIIGFIKGFSHNFLLGALGDEKLNEFYIVLASKIDGDIDRIRRNQWRHCILTLSK